MGQVEIVPRGLLVCALLVLTQAIALTHPNAAYAEPSTEAETNADAVAVSATEPATLIKIVELGELPSPIIDPGGITYLADRNRLLIADSEIDEEPIFMGVNLFELDLEGSLTATGLNPDPPGKSEPTGLAYDPANASVFSSNDATDAVTTIESGADDLFGTDDDVVTTPDYSALVIDDLEDVAYSDDRRMLFLLDAADQIVYGVDAGSNGEFDGISPHGDDGFLTIELPPLGILGAEGLEYRAVADTLLVTDASDDAIYEVAIDGRLTGVVDLSFLKRSGIPLSPTDVAIAPASDDSSSEHLYVVDRGSDNGNPDDGVPAPRDGRLIEIEAPLGAGRFIDDDTSVFETDIEWLADQGITFGCNPPANDVFCPDELVTRGQMAAFLVRALDLTSGAGSDRFVDDDGSVFESDIERLAAAGITKGCNPPDGDRFCPGSLVSRGQMAAMLVRALAYTFAGEGDLFLDDDDSIFEADIDKVGTAGVTRGCNPPANDRFCPDEYVTRGQMAAFLHRAIG